MSTIPSAYKDLLEKKAFASLATVNADGSMARRLDLEG